LTQAWACGFLIYNTHSVPVTADALELSPPVGQWNDPRQIVTSLMVGIDIWSPGLEVDYRMPPVASPPPDPADYSNQVLQGVSLGSALGIDVQPPVTDSQGVASFRTWDAPFLWADSKSAFYVTTSEELIDISSKYVGFLYSAQKAWGGNQAVVPNLVVSRPQPDPAPPPPVMTDHFLASGSNIRTAIRSAASINFGGQEVGPTGGVIQEAGPGQEEVL